jgi:membrane-associated phospholipid phosphatase
VRVGDPVHVSIRLGVHHDDEHRAVLIGVHVGLLKQKADRTGRMRAAVTADQLSCGQAFPDPAFTGRAKNVRVLRYRYLVLRMRISKPGDALRIVAAGGAATLLVSWGLGKLVQADAVTRASRRIYDYCRDHRSAAVARRLDQAVTTMGDYCVIAPFSVLVGAMVAYERRQWTPLPLLASGVVSEVYLQKALKRLVNGTLPPAESSIGSPGDFPSGGAARTVITFGLLAHMLAQHWNSPAERRVIWSIVAMLVVAQGGSRLYLGRHWPEDILGGWVFGWLVLRTLTKVDELVSA